MKDFYELSNLDKRRTISVMKRLRRRGIDISQVWVVARKEDGEITRSLILPESAVPALTPALRATVRIYCGTLIIHNRRE